MKQFSKTSSPQKKQTAAPPARPQQAQPTQEEISLLAYQFYLDRGGEHGKDQEDWLRAEMVLRGRN